MKFISYNVNNNVKDKELKAYHKFFLGEKSEKTNFDIYSKALATPDLLEGKYAGEVLERFHEIGLLPEHESYENFLISSITTLFNDSNNNTEQLLGYGARLAEHIDVVTDKLAAFVSKMATLRFENNISNDSLKLICLDVKTDSLTFEQKRNILAMLYSRYTQKNKWDDDVYAKESVYNARKSAPILYFLTHFTEDEYKMLNREEKMLFIYLSVFVQASRKLKKAEFKDVFLYKLATKSTSLLRKEYEKVEKKDIDDYVDNIAFLEHKTDFLVLHFEVMNTRYLKALNENAYQRLINEMSDVFRNLDTSIYDAEYDLFRRIFENDHLAIKNGRLYASLEKLNKDDVFDLIYFVVSMENNNFYINLDMKLSSGQIESIYKKAINKDDITFTVLHELFNRHKNLDKTKANAELLIQMYNKVIEVLKNEKLNNEDYTELLSKIKNKIDADTIELLFLSEIEGYKIENPYLLKDMAIIELLNYYAELKNPLEFISSEYFSEKEKAVYMFRLDLESSLKFLEDCSEEQLMELLKYKLDAVALFDSESFVSTAIYLYENILELENPKFATIEKEIYSLLEEINESVEKKNFLQSSRLNQYFIQSKEEAFAYLKDMKIFSYTLSKNDITQLTKSLRRLGDYLITDKEVFDKFFDKYKREVHENISSYREVSKLSVILLTNQLLEEKLPLFKEQVNEVVAIIRKRLNDLIPIFSDELLFKFILEEKSKFEAVTEVQE